MPDPAGRFDRTDAQIEGVARDVLHLVAENDVRGAVAVDQKLLDDLYAGEFEAFSWHSAAKGSSMS